MLDEDLLSNVDFRINEVQPIHSLSQQSSIPTVYGVAIGTAAGWPVYTERVDIAYADDAAAVAAAAGGNRAESAAAFGALVERYQQVAFRAAWLITRDAQDAEDVAQEAFVRAYRQLHTFRQGEPFRPWLLRIVQNQALNAVRSRGRRTGLVGRFAAIAPRTAPAPHAEVAAADESSQVLAAIDRLPPDDRVVLQLRYFLDLPEREIATAIGRPTGTVKSRLHRASQRLREVIEREYPHLKERGDG